MKKIKKFLVVVITRAYLPRGHKHDEFVLWYKNLLKDPVATDALLLQMSPRMDLLVLHGCREHFMEPDPENLPENISGRIREVTGDAEQYHEIHVALHDPAMYFNLRDLKENLKNVASLCIFSTMLGNYIFSALEEINIPEQDKKMIFSYFSDLLKEGWEKYLDPSQSLEEIKRRQRVIKLK